MIQKFVMKCTQDQFKIHFAEKLKDLGYSGHMMSYYQDAEDGPYIYLNKEYRRYTDLNFFPHGMFKHTEMTDLGRFNPDLFLAIACMSNTSWGIPGEYWKFIDKDTDFIPGKLYMASDALNQKKVFIDECGNANGFNKEPIKNNNLKFFRKASVEEIVEHFKAIELAKVVTPEALAEKLRKIQELVK